MRKKILKTTSLASLLMLTMLCPTMDIPAAEVTESEQTETVENDTYVDDEEGWEDDEEEVDEDEEDSFTEGDSTEEAADETADETLPDEWADDAIWNAEEKENTGNQSISQNSSKKSTKSVKTKASSSYDRSFRTGVQEHMVWIASLAAILLFMGVAFMIWAYRIKRHARKELQSINRFEQDRTDP